MSLTKNCFSLALENDQIVIADKLLGFPAIKKDDFDSLCSTIIDNIICLLNTEPILSCHPKIDLPLSILMDYIRGV